MILYKAFDSILSLFSTRMPPLVLT